MKVRDVMSAPVVTVRPDTPFDEVVDRLLENEISGLPVVDTDGNLLGMVTEADLVSKEAYGLRRRRALELLADYFRGRDPQWVRKAAGRTARDVMTTAPVTATPDEDVSRAARRMLEWRHKRLPVVEDGKVVGIVSRHDLLGVYRRDDMAIADDIDEILADSLAVPETHHAQATVTDGVVSLYGNVQWPSDRRLLEAVVGQVAGVVAVENHLHVRQPEPRSTEDSR